MKKLIVANQEQINWDATFVEPVVIDEVEGQILPDNLQMIDQASLSRIPAPFEAVYLPVEELDKVENHEQAYVYCDLTLYPFFHEVKNIMQENDSKKGVCRVRRTFSDDVNDMRIAGDIFVLNELFGEPEHIFVKRAKQAEKVSHIIVTINYGNGTMAHIDYTFHDAFRIEFEWSGIGKIIEFNSEESAPVVPIKNIDVPLTFTVESILENSRKLDASVLAEINDISMIVKGDAAK